MGLTIPAIAPGFYDSPYIYAKSYYQYTTSALAGNTGLVDDIIQSDGDSDFFARRAYGIQNFNDENGQAFLSGTGAVIPIDPPSGGIINDFPLAPEKYYRLGAGIPIQILQTNGAYGNNTYSLFFAGGTNTFAYVTSVLFQGVKRRRGVPDTDPNYKFYEKPFTYVLPVNINWLYLKTPYTAFQPMANQTFYKQILDFDFELWGIEVGVNPRSNGTNGFRMILYDANGYRLMNDFVHYRQLALNGEFASNNAPGVYGNTLVWNPNCFPCPPVVYPKGSSIQVDIQSLADTFTGAMGNVFINFKGVRRIPC